MFTLLIHIIHTLLQVPKAPITPVIQDTNMDWVSILREFGLPLVGLAVLSYCCIKASIWVANNVVVPLVTRHIAFLDSMTTANKSTEAAVIEIKVAHKNTEDLANKILSAVGNMNTTIEKQNSLFEKFFDELEEMKKGYQCKAVA